MRYMQSFRKIHAVVMFGHPLSGMGNNSFVSPFMKKRYIQKDVNNIYYVKFNLEIGINPYKRSKEMIIEG